MNADTSELRALSADLGRIGATTTAAMFETFAGGAKDVRDEWRRNARETSRTHAKHYPDTITSKPRIGLNIEFEVSPDPRINRQAYLSEILEFGGTHSPPHLDAQRASDAAIPRLQKAVGATVDRLLGDL